MIILSKTYYTIWLLVFGIICVIYLLNMYKKTLQTKDNKDDTNDKDIKDKNKLITKIQTYLIIIIFGCTLFGFLVYMGYKKLEYKDHALKIRNISF